VQHLQVKAVAAAEGITQEEAVAEIKEGQNSLLFLFQFRMN
jgi:hypothetical protein